MILLRITDHNIFDTEFASLKENPSLTQKCLDTLKGNHRAYGK